MYDTAPVVASKLIAFPRQYTPAGVVKLKSKAEFTVIVNTLESPSVEQLSVFVETEAKRL